MDQAAPAVQTIETSDSVISYRDLGEGPVILLLHGGGPGATGWGNFSGNAADLASKFRVIVPDQPGFGASRLVKDSGATYHALSAQTMAEFLGILGISRAHVVGNSMGGGVALRMAMQHPDLVDKLVLMGPWIPGFGIPLLAPLPVPLLQEYYPDPTPEKMRLLIKSMVYAPTFENFDELVTSRYAASIDPDIAAGYARMGTGTDPDPDPRPMWDQVAAIPHETLLLWGRDDRHCSLDDAFQYLAAMRNSQLMIFRQTGHWVQVEQRQAFAKHVTAFLAD
jgi:2-hydroxy-6-oxonona-2,4-dienedioate hydrolase/4,5:9,10-diseco-3-hydroxy-5,9,17-trioxoandrosta-1(10),2-diene-4-oate hydrolase